MNIQSGFLIRASLLMLCAASAFPQDTSWTGLTTALQGQKIQVRPEGGETIRGQFVSIQPDGIVVRTGKGEQSIARTSVREIKVQAPSRRVRNGVLGTAIGTAAGVGIGFAVCPHCANEGNGGKFVGPGAAIGAGVGALAFLPTPYRIVYKAKKR